MRENWRGTATSATRASSASTEFHEHRHAAQQPAVSSLLRPVPAVDTTDRRRRERTFAALWRQYMSTESRARSRRRRAMRRVASQASSAQSHGEDDGQRHRATPAPTSRIRSASRPRPRASSSRRRRARGAALGANDTVTVALAAAPARGAGLAWPRRSPDTMRRRRRMLELWFGVVAFPSWRRAAPPVRRRVRFAAETAAAGDSCALWVRERTRPTRPSESVLLSAAGTPGRTLRSSPRPRWRRRRSRRAGRTRRIPAAALSMSPGASRGELGGALDAARASSVARARRRGRGRARRRRARIAGRRLRRLGAALSCRWSWTPNHRSPGISIGAVRLGSGPSFRCAAPATRRRRQHRRRRDRGRAGHPRPPEAGTPGSARRLTHAGNPCRRGGRGGREAVRLRRSSRSATARCRAREVGVDGCPQGRLEAASSRSLCSPCSRGLSQRRHGRCRRVRRWRR